MGAMREDDTWLGGCYELAVLLGPPDDDRLAAARAALWRLGGFAGTPPRGTVEPLPGRPVAAQVSGLRLDDEDWAFLELPLGALSRWDPAVGAFPFGAEAGARSRAWREPLEAWLVDVGRRLHDEVPYVRAVTGWEASAVEPGGGDGHHAVLEPVDDRLEVTPVSRWDFGGPVAGLSPEARPARWWPFRRRRRGPRPPRT
jgi:hypothetical protein